MYDGTFSLDLMNGPSDPVDVLLSDRALGHMLNAFFGIYCDFLAAHPNFPRLYDTGVFYMTPEAPCGGDLFQDLRTTLQRGHGDCKELSCWRAAELFVRDRIETARPCFRRRWVMRDERGRPVPFAQAAALYHVAVRVHGFTVEDPSRRLGMPDFAPEYAREAGLTEPSAWMVHGEQPFNAVG